jgi:hypothetical protein
VAGEFGVFQESPPLVPEEIDEEATVSAAEVTVVAIEETVVERVRVTEHFLAVEFIPARLPDRRSRPRHSRAEFAP